MMAEAKDRRNYLTRFLGTFIGALVLILLIGYLYFFEIRKPSEEEKKEKVFPAIKEEQINEISLKYPSHTVVCRKEGESWFVFKNSKKFKADGKVISSITENIAQMKIEKVASQNLTDLAGFGLDSPEVEVIPKTPEKEHRILIGVESPVGSGTYIRVDNDSRVLLVSRSSIWDFVGKSANDLRDKQVLSLKEDKIKGLGFKWKGSSGSEVATQREGFQGTTFEVERTNGDWIGKDIPQYVEIDQARVWTILRTFLNLKIDNFEDDEPKKLSAYGLDKPSAEIELFENGKSIQVSFGNKKETGDYYVKLGSEDSVYSVSEFVLRQIPENVNDIRVRTVVKVDIGKITGVEIKRGDTNISILKEGNNWKLGGDKDKKIDESKVREIIAEIDTFEVEKFVDDNPEDLAIYGFDKPEIQLTISESDKKITLLFGKKEDKKVYAKLADGKSVYLVSDKILSKIPFSRDELIKK